MTAVDWSPRPAQAGERFGIFVVVRMAKMRANGSLCAVVKCSRCGLESVRVLTALRHRPPSAHRWCER